MTGSFEVAYGAGRIASIKPVDAAPPPSDGTLWLTPGLFDIQVNGMLGYDFSGRELSVEMVQKIHSELEKRGILRWCPTICTQSPEIVERNLVTIRHAIDDGLTPNVHCIHLEGHYISSEEGYRGVHAAKFIRDPDPGEFDKWQQAAGGHIGLFSLSPERKGALSFIQKLRADGVRVGLVHHHCDYETIRAAAAAGADLSSHLLNGCAPLIHRQHNVIWAQLSLRELWASFIADGFHIPPYTLRALINSKGLDRSILTSDLGYLAGKPDGEYSTTDGNVVVLKDGGLWVKGKGTDLLSGAAKTLNQNVEYLSAHAGFSIEQSLLLASRNPAQYFGISRELDIYPGRGGPAALFRWQHEGLSVEAILK
ncbi:MAG: N-acetylglucosamine-6-phosphate deacetylase [Spirochaetes bacterium]|nr:N-acetylglucosamine-6-phosphate deacetylase [Spirochaetota bacterium]